MVGAVPRLRRSQGGGFARWSGPPRFVAVESIDQPPVKERPVGPGSFGQGLPGPGLVGQGSQAARVIASDWRARDAGGLRLPPPANTWTAQGSGPSGLSARASRSANHACRAIAPRLRAKRTINTARTRNATTNSVNPTVNRVLDAAGIIVERL